MMPPIKCVHGLQKVEGYGGLMIQNWISELYCPEEDQTEVDSLLRFYVDLWMFI